MGFNSKEIKITPTTKITKNPYSKDIDYISKMGYRDDSPFRDRDSIDIYTPTGIIDMSNTGIPIIANSVYLPPYSGQHQFDTDIVTESKIQDDEDEMRYGGNRRLRRSTTNPFTGINKVMMRNITIYGRPGRQRFVPPKQEGGPVRWLDELQDGGSETVNQPKPRYVQDVERQQMLKQSKEDENARLYKEHQAKLEFWKQHPGYSDDEKEAIQNKIDNPWTANPAGNLASWATRLEGMQPEDVVKTYGNVGESLKYAAGISQDAMINEMAGKAIGIAGKKAGKLVDAINPMAGMKKVRAAYPNLSERAYADINTAAHPIFYNGVAGAVGGLSPVIYHTVAGDNPDPEDLMKQMGIGMGAGFIGGNMLRNKTLMKQISEHLPYYQKYDAERAGLTKALDEIPHKAFKNMADIEKEMYFEALNKQKNINTTNLGNPTGNVWDILPGFNKPYTGKDAYKTLNLNKFGGQTKWLDKYK